MAAVSPPRPGLNDIIYHIVSHLNPDPKTPGLSFNRKNESKSARKALACLARTHSSFAQPALAEMWRSLPSKSPLEHLLCVVGIAHRPPPERGDEPALEMCATPATRKAGWIRFQEYASFVREIIIDPLSHTSLDDNAELLQDTFWCRLLSSCGNTPILPRLEAATVRSSNAHHSIDTGVLRLLNPSICGFKVAFDQASPRELEQLGKALTLYFPWTQNLRVLSMEVRDLTPFLDMESLASSHPHLCCIKLKHGSPVKLGSLCCLAHLPNLEDLHIKLDTWDQEAPTNLPMTFPRLRSLLLVCGGFVAVDVVVNHMNAPRLQAFSVNEVHSNNTTMPEISTHLRTLVAKCPALTTFTWVSKQISLRRKMGYLTGRRAPAPLAELLAPLLSHRTMRHLTVLFHGPIVPYTPADFRAMAEAWPDLETFALDDKGEKYFSWTERYADPESIVTLARHCPRLRSLHLPMVHFDPSSESSVVGELARRPPTQHWLQELLVGQITVPCSGDDSEEDEECCRDAVVQFCRMMATVFRSAVIRSLSDIATAMTVGAVVSDY